MGTETKAVIALDADSSNGELLDILWLLADN